jgi:hypothetical protein
MTARLLHYSKEPLGEVVSRAHQEDHFKPHGLWVSVGGGEDSWLAWCRSESFRLECLAVCTEIILKPDANVLWLKTCGEIDAFTAKYDEVPQSLRGSSLNYRGRFIAWERVAAAHQGIIIAPYQWHRRLHDGSGWYYGWDCASGCIWNADAIAEVRQQPAEIAA